MKIKITGIQFRHASGGSSRTNRQAKTRIYICPIGETILDDLESRAGRPHQEFRKQVLPALFMSLDMPKDTKVNWSQSAGCTMCPCSPAFIMDGHIQHPSGGYADIWVDVEGSVSEKRDIKVVV